MDYKRTSRKNDQSECPPKKRRFNELELVSLAGIDEHLQCISDNYQTRLERGDEATSAPDWFPDFQSWLSRQKPKTLDFKAENALDDKTNVTHFLFVVYGFDDDEVFKLYLVPFSDFPKGLRMVPDVHVHEEGLFGVLRNLSQSDMRLFQSRYQYLRCFVDTLLLGVDQDVLDRYGDEEEEHRDDILPSFWNYEPEFLGLLSDKYEVDYENLKTKLFGVSLMYVCPIDMGLE